MSENCPQTRYVYKVKFGVISDNYYKKLKIVLKLKLNWKPGFMTLPWLVYLDVLLTRRFEFLRGYFIMCTCRWVVKKKEN